MYIRFIERTTTGDLCKVNKGGRYVKKSLGSQPKSQSGSKWTTDVPLTRAPRPPVVLDIVITFHLAVSKHGRIGGFLERIA